MQLLKALFNGRCNILNIIIYSINNGTLLDENRNIYISSVSVCTNELLGCRMAAFSNLVYDKY